MRRMRHVVITGGGRGIGAAAAQRFKESGDKVSVMARTRPEIEELADSIGAYAVRIDVGDPASVEAAFMAAGPVDVLINNAGMARPSRVEKTDVRVWEEHLKVNLTGAFLCSLKVLPSMVSRGSGRIINMASDAGLDGFAYATAYCASKHGLVGFTRALSAEVSHNGVTVNALCPGNVDSPLTHSCRAIIEEKTGNADDPMAQWLLGSSPDRIYTPDEVADALFYMAGPSMEGVTGQALTMDEIKK